MAEISLLTLANHAEIQNGLLYMSGAEWDTLTRYYDQGKTPEPHRIAIALTVVVPWSETNHPQHVAMWIEDEDGGSRLLEQQLDLKIGRPPGRVPGSESRAPIVYNTSVDFPKQGGYRIVAEAGEDRRRRTYSFRVIDRISPAT
jgi:hypothetical protein